MSASDRTPTGSPLADPTRDSDLGLPRTYGRTNGDELVTRDDEALVSSARGGEKRALIYLVEWPDHYFAKVGVSTCRRWVAFLRRGGVLRYLYEPTNEHASIEEARLHKWIRDAGFPPAFASKAEAEPFLGTHGAGWTECYRLGERQLMQIDELAARRRDA